MTPSWLAPSVALALALASLAAASRAPGEVDVGRGDFRAGEGEPARLVRGAPCNRAGTGRVVSAALLSDELLLDTLPSSRLVGVSYVVDWKRSTPAYGRFPAAMARVSGAAEEVLLLEPESVVVSDYTSGATEAQLASAGVCVLRVRAPRTFEDLFAEAEELGLALSAEAAASRVVQTARARLATLASLPPPRARRALLVQSPYAYGRRTLQDDCLRYAGLENALTSDFAPTPTLSVERLASVAPDVVFLATDTEVPRPLRAAQRPRGAGFDQIAALERGAAFEIPASWMASLSHHALDACEAYAALARSVP